jgi:hypothetical protein
VPPTTGAGPRTSYPAPGYSGGPGYPSQSILDQVWSIINPQLQSAADIINRRSQMASGYITGATNTLVSHMGGIPGMVSGAFNPEIKMGRGVAEYTRGALVGAGKTQAQGLGQALQSIGPAAMPALDLAQQGKGAGGAAYGTGIAELDAMIAKKAASSARAALEPSFAAGMGQQQQGLVAAQLARALADQQSEIEARVPELLLNLQQQEYAREADRRDYELRLRQFESERKGAAGANAPTVAGRIAYWNTVAAQRTEQTGTVYRGTSTGIRPVLDQSGRPIRSLQGKAADVVTPTKLQMIYGKNGKVVAVDPVTGKVVNTVLNAIPDKPTLIKGGDGRQYMFDPNTQSMSPVAGTNPKSKSATPKKKEPFYKGTAPRRVGPNHWKDRKGKDLVGQAHHYWEVLFQKGYVNNRGQIIHPIPKGPQYKTVDQIPDYNAGF